MYKSLSLTILRRQGGGTHTWAASILKALQMAPEVLCLCAWHDSAGIRRSRTYVLPSSLQHVIKIDLSVMPPYDHHLASLS